MDVIVCPECGSRNIWAGLKNGDGLTEQHCRRCGCYFFTDDKGLRYDCDNTQYPLPVVKWRRGKMINKPKSKMQQSRWYYKLRYIPTRIRRWALEDQAGNGLGGPPNNWRTTDWIIGDTGRTDDGTGKSVPSYQISARFNNDAHEIWIAEKYIEGNSHSEKWAFFTRAGTFRTIALWYLWRWAWGEWFGLRRKLFYWDNHRRCEKMRRGVEEEGKDA